MLKINIRILAAGGWRTAKFHVELSVFQRTATDTNRLEQTKRTTCRKKVAANICNRVCSVIY